MKKGRHRRFEEARALKRSQDVDLDVLFTSLSTDDGDKPEHQAWASEFDDDDVEDDDGESDSDD